MDFAGSAAGLVKGFSDFKKLKKVAERNLPGGSRIGSFLDNYEVAGSYGQQSNMPDYVYESLQRQMGPGYGFGDYKTEDMKNVINWNAGRLRI